jgi:hypothetical protein
MDRAATIAIMGQGRTTETTDQGLTTARGLTTTTTNSAIEVSPRCELRLKGFAKMWAVTGCLGTVMGDVDRESTVTKTDGS